jgi:hypothetical protein
MRLVSWHQFGSKFSLKSSSGEAIRNRTVREALQFTALSVPISTVSTGRQRKKKEAKKKEMATTTTYPIPPLPHGEIL